MRNYVELLCYTRIPMDEEIYSGKLAYSMHLAVTYDRQRYWPLNHNSGVLFAKATVNRDGTLNAKSLKRPFLLAAKEGGYWILAIRTLPEGEADEESRGCILVYRSRDLLQYEEVGLLRVDEEDFVQDVRGEYDPKRQCYLVQWENEAGAWYQMKVEDFERPELNGVKESISARPMEKIHTDIQGCVPGNVIEIGEVTEKRLINRLTVPVNCSMQVPETVCGTSQEEMDVLTVTACYTDGSTAEKQVDWDLTHVDFETAGIYSVKGKVERDFSLFPFAVNRADPNIIWWKGRFYFIATNDEDQNHTFYIRVADTIPELAKAEEHLVLDTDTYPYIRNLLWAPEFHSIDDELYLFFAATTGEFFYEEAYLMKLKHGGNPTDRREWEPPRKVVDRNGTALCRAGEAITLDMTYFQWEGTAYAVWSQRQFLPVDQGAWLYIAALNRREPWKLCSDPVVLSRPEYGWENNHAFVNEGPYTIPGKDKLFLTYSAAATDTTYTVGLMEIERGFDLLKPENWRKSNCPMLTSRSVPGEYGPGHNSYVRDEEGCLWNVYHARPNLDGPRCAGVRRVHFGEDGYPVLAMTEDVAEAFRCVETKIIIKEKGSVIHEDK